MSYRTRLGGELRAGDAGTRVTLAGWVARRRDHGGLVFVDLRDRAGIVQLVLDPDQAPGPRRRARPAQRVRRAGRGRGHARDRPRPSTRSCPPARSRSASTGWRCCRAASVLPFQLDDEGVDETLRLHHRYLDLRRDEMRHNLWTRFRLTQIDPPAPRGQRVLGARDADPLQVDAGGRPGVPGADLEPTRASSTRCRSRRRRSSSCTPSPATSATTRSPAASGTRPRAPIAPQEFTQLDIEMAFLDPEELFELMEALFARVWRELLGVGAGRAVPRA